ncbi:MAG: OmpA family protein [Pseudomonadota bacterium]
MRLARPCLIGVLCAFAGPVLALDLSLPATASETATRNQALAQQAVPVGPFAGGDLPTRVFEGSVRQRAYRIAASDLTPLQILAPLRAQVEAAGYQVLLDCNQQSCGGFDFRFGIDVLPAPNMYVNIRAYHFLSAVSADGSAAVTVLASAASGAGYVQIAEVGTGSAAPVVAAPVLAAPVDGDDLAGRLLGAGYMVLETLDFAVGSTALNTTETTELAALAAVLADRPGLRIAVVGHTDTVGELEANITVSRARAQAVRTALIDTYGAPADRIEAEGMGYLSPVASNLTPEGREANRRVEVIVVSEDD